MATYLILILVPADAKVTLAYDAEEERRLREVVAAAPGVVQVDDIMRHPRGGYLVSMKREGDALEISDHVRAAGWMSVI